MFFLYYIDRCKVGGATAWKVGGKGGGEWVLPSNAMSSAGGEIDLVED